MHCRNCFGDGIKPLPSVLEAEKRAANCEGQQTFQAVFQRPRIEVEDLELSSPKTISAGVPLGKSSWTPRNWVSPKMLVSRPYLEEVDWEKAEPGTPKPPVFKALQAS